MLTWLTIVGFVGHALVVVVVVYFGVRALGVVSRAIRGGVRRGGDAAFGDGSTLRDRGSENGDS